MRMEAGLQNIIGNAGGILQEDQTWLEPTNP